MSTRQFLSLKNVKIKEGNNSIFAVRHKIEVAFTKVIIKDLLIELKLQLVSTWIFKYKIWRWAYDSIRTQAGMVASLMW